MAHTLAIHMYKPFDRSCSSQTHFTAPRISTNKQSTYHQIRLETPSKLTDSLSNWFAFVIFTTSFHIVLKQPSLITLCYWHNINHHTTWSWNQWDMVYPKPTLHTLWNSYLHLGSIPSNSTWDSIDLFTLMKVDMNQFQMVDFHWSKWIHSN